MNTMALKSPASPLFTQPFIQTQITGNIKASRHWPLRARNSPVTGEFPAQKASNTENVSISWRHHDSFYFLISRFWVQCLWPDVFLQFNDAVVCEYAEKYTMQHYYLAILVFVWYIYCLIILMASQDVRHFAADIFKCFFLDANMWISINMSLKFVLRVKLTIFQHCLTWWSEALMVALLTHVWVTRRQWVHWV